MIPQRGVEPDWYLGPSRLYRRTSYWVYDYRLMRRSEENLWIAP